MNIPYLNLTFYEIGYIQHRTTTEFMLVVHVIDVNVPSYIVSVVNVVIMFIERANTNTIATQTCCAASTYLVMSFHFNVRLSVRSWSVGLSVQKLNY